MPDWLKSMQQTYEYYIVDPGTWRDVKRLDNVKSCSITRDSEVVTLGSATIDTDEPLEECYVRVYLITIQNGVKERHPLGTYLVQTPSVDFDGMVSAVSMDAYTPLLELKENPPPIGYYVEKGKNIMDTAYMIVRDNVRAPVVPTACEKTIPTDFISETSDTWMTFASDLIANAKYEFALDEMGRILFSPKRDLASLQPVWTFNDDNSSILYPELQLTHDLYGIPNVVEVVYSKDTRPVCARVVNDDPNSPISTINRGREIIYRETNPSFIGEPTQLQIDLYAEQLLSELSTIKRTVTYSHGYCPVRLGDCVRLNYSRAGLVDVKAKVISQTINCKPGCQVKEKAVFTTKLWR